VASSRPPRRSFSALPTETRCDGACKDLEQRGVVPNLRPIFASSVLELLHRVAIQAGLAKYAFATLDRRIARGTLDCGSELGRLLGKQGENLGLEPPELLQQLVGWRSICVEFE